MKPLQLASKSMATHSSSSSSKDNILNGVIMGIGTWAWGDRPVWGYGGYDENLNDSTAESAFKKSITSGLKLIDTAPMYGYGESERLIGRFLKTLSPKEREDLVIATKYMPLPWHIDVRKTCLATLKESLNRLQLDCVDLFQIHGPALSIRSIENLTEGLVDAYDAGLTKAVGVSNFNKDQVLRAHKVLNRRDIPLTSNQIEFSLLRTCPSTNGLLATCADFGVKVLAYSPLGMGRLTGKYSLENPLPKNRIFGNVPIKEMMPLLDKMRDVAAANNKTISQIAINWVICKGAIPIPGAKNEKQAEQNAGALGWNLSANEIEELDKLGFQGSTNWFWQHG